MTTQKDLLRFLGIVGYELYLSHIVGNNCPANQERFDRIKKQVVNDLVLETSSTRYWIHDTAKTPWHAPENCIGYFIRKEWEPVPDWEERPPDELLPKELVWYIRSLDGDREMRWVNADFVTILPVEGWA